MKLIAWQDELKSLYHSSRDLLLDLELNADSTIGPIAPSFPIRVPRSFASRMKKGDPNDPLLRQVLPIIEEDSNQKSPVSLSTDPLQEEHFVKSKGVLQKFQGRILIVSTGYCPVHCRYCFRRHFDYAQQQISLKDWSITLDGLRKDSSITEVIFSGGDPLTLPDNKLEVLFLDLEKIPHIKTIRIHTRFPIVIPSRLTPQLKSLLKGPPSSKVRRVVVLHINHANELDEALCQTLRLWSQEGILFFNQAVLLKGVNDSFEAQHSLWNRTFEAGVHAYYLHQFDPVENAGHFYVPIEIGRSLMKKLRSTMPGYMVPLYVQEVPFAKSKIPLESYTEELLTQE